MALAEREGKVRRKRGGRERKEGIVNEGKEEERKGRIERGKGK